MQSDTPFPVNSELAKGLASAIMAMSSIGAEASTRLQMPLIAETVAFGTYRVLACIYHHVDAE